MLLYDKLSESNAHFSQAQVHVCLSRIRFCPDHVVICSLLASHHHHLQNMFHGVYLKVDQKDENQETD